MPQRRPKWGARLVFARFMFMLELGRVKRVSHKLGERPIVRRAIAVVVYACAEHRASRRVEDKSGTLLPPPLNS